MAATRLRRIGRAALAGMALAVGSTVCNTAWAAWPHDKTIRLVVPFAAGGSTDLIARKVAEGLSKDLDANVIVENRPGAGGTIGSDFVARQPADGYTILMGSVSTHGSAECIYAKLPYDPIKDFTPLGVVASIPNLMVIGQSVPANTLQEFIALLKKDPEHYSYASNGLGTSNHLAAELFKATAGVSMTHVPYRGSGPALIDVLGGQVNMMMDVVMTSYPYVKDGKLKALAVTSSQRHPMLPDVPTVAEQGFPGFEAIVWFGLLAPAKLPEAVSKPFIASFERVMHSPDMKTYLEGQGAEIPDITGPAFATMIHDEVDKWCKVAKQANIHLD
ncbi:MAG TPA: tripartite tricarboxylate transporter substrate binding protein [Bordetella sp.]